MKGRIFLRIPGKTQAQFRIIFKEKMILQYLFGITHDVVDGSGGERVSDPCTMLCVSPGCLPGLDRVRERT